MMMCGLCGRKTNDPNSHACDAKSYLGESKIVRCPYCLEMAPEDKSHPCVAIRSLKESMNSTLKVIQDEFKNDIKALDSRLKMLERHEQRIVLHDYENRIQELKEENKELQYKLKLIVEEKSKAIIDICNVKADRDSYCNLYNYWKGLAERAQAIICPPYKDHNA